MLEVKDLVTKVRRQRRKVNSLGYFVSPSCPQLAEKLTSIINEEVNNEAKNTLMAQAIVYHLTRNGKFFKKQHGGFNDSFYISGDKNIVYKTCSDSFVSYIARITGISRASILWKYVKCAIEDESISEETVVTTPKNYWYVSNEATYISYKQGKLVRIDRNGIREVNNGQDGVLIPETHFVEPWTIVERFYDPFKSLLAFKAGSFRNWTGPYLLKLWVLSIFCLPAKLRRPILALCGDSNSGKRSMGQTILTMLGLPGTMETLDPSEKSSESFWNRVDKGGIIALSNVDEHIVWLPNALCCAASGDDQNRRELYTDKGEITYSPNAWLLITSKGGSFAGHPAVADRLLIVDTKTRAEGLPSFDNRLSSQAREFRDSIMSWICSVVLKFHQSPKSEYDIIKRAPSFSAVAMTLAKILGEEDEGYQALLHSEVNKKFFNISHNGTGQIIWSLATSQWIQQPFEGNAQALMRILQEQDETYKARSVSELVNEMRDLLPNLSKAIHISVGGPASNPIYKICGPKDRPDSYSDDQTISIEEAAAKDKMMGEKINPYTDLL